ncbi:GNAT family N-acetyltransferase [Methylocystis sp. JR02]|uniref:GNAT family N-acetyltransferase n=1 Tax=Methylocystis sp. JR02 TaxID=3046284 RepID=UPI0024B9636F|nr:GNAT family N-acetyltransferase [Methylocystis sp. JR02]MDJ0449151.1 GNAT family N-acetyltransferase [Methylocystis sp. JR02]
MTIRRLLAADAEAFHHLRLEAFRLEPRCFRYAPQDEAGVGGAEKAARLERDFVVGYFAGDALAGAAGLTFFSGAKLGHKALLWGMYLRAAHRGSGAADRLMEALLEQARSRVEIVMLTVVDENARAKRFYERWGFTTYGVEPHAAKLGDGDYLDEALMALRLR